MLLSTYNVLRPETISNLPAMCIDSVSQDILKQFHPVLLSHVYPAQTMGDGNCLYRAISRSLHGTESCFHILCIMTYQTENI